MLSRLRRADGGSDEHDVMAAFRWVPLVVSVPLLIALAIVRPTSPDLIAQLSRSTAPGVTWWTTWYGGITTPSYSVLTPTLMSLFGVWLVGILSVVAICWYANSLLVGQYRPRAAALFLAIGAVGNLACGRVTFGVGAALGLFGLVAVKRNASLRAAIAGVLATFASPLAGLFLVIFALAIARDATYRRAAIAIGATSLAALGSIAIFFPTQGVMPMKWGDLFLGVGSCAIIGLTTRNRIIRDAAVALGIITLLCFVTHTAVGKNIVRLPMVFGAGIFIVATRIHKVWIALILLGFGGIFAANVVTELHISSDRSAREAYYKPLLAQLPPNGEATNRIEVVDPLTHGPALYVAKHVPVARGWERQADRFRNPLFYEPGLLNADSYREWLRSLAVRWVALPDTKLDRAARDEAVLIRSGLPYLRLSWQNADWKLYEFTEFTPMADPPLEVVKLEQNRVILRASAPGEALVRVAWTPGVVVGSVESKTSSSQARANVAGAEGVVPGCAQPDSQERPDGAWTKVHIDTPGEFQLYYAGHIPLKNDPGACATDESGRLNTQKREMK